MTLIKAIITVLAMYSLAKFLIYLLDGTTYAATTPDRLLFLGMLVGLMAGFAVFASSRA